MEREREGEFGGNGGMFVLTFNSILTRHWPCASLRINLPFKIFDLAAVGTGAGWFSIISRFRW